MVDKNCHMCSARVAKYEYRNDKVVSKYLNQVRAKARAALSTEIFRHWPALGDCSAIATMVTLSVSEKEFTRQGCHDDCRVDGRRRLDHRPYVILSETSVADAPLILSTGSARLVTMDLNLLCSVKAQVVHPAPMSPDQGVVDLHVDTLSAGTLRSELDRLEGLLTHLLVSHGELVDLKALCILPGSYVWRLQIDVYVLNDAGGNLIDAASHTIRAALQSTRLPGVSTLENKNDGNVELQVDGDVTEGLPGADRAPVVVTVSILRHRGSPVLILDATPEEEECAVAQVFVAVDDQSIVAVAGGGMGMGQRLLPEIANLATNADTSRYYVKKKSGQNSMLQGLFVYS